MDDQKKSYDPAHRKIMLGKEEGRRFKKLGDMGEAVAPVLLEEAGFNNIMNLNNQKMNFLFADFYAEKDGDKYLISVKTRNKYENSGNLNTRYKLGRKLYHNIETVLGQDDYKDCIPAWMAIAMDDSTFDAYFGTVGDLEGGFGIPMSKRACEKHLCLARNRIHDFDPGVFKNIYRKR